MSGHSKWSTIKRQKQETDTLRGQIFTKLGNAITLAVREGGGPNIDTNFKLRLMTEKARQANMPKANIERAIQRATGKDKANNELVEVIYEGFGHTGLAVLAEGVTDNKQRTAAEVKNAFTKHHGILGAAGCVSYLFDRTAEIRVEKSLGFDAILEAAIEARALDMVEEESEFVIITKPENVHTVKDLLFGKSIPIIGTEIGYRPKTFITAVDVDVEKQLILLLSALEELPDIHKVTTNAEFIAA